MSCPRTFRLDSLCQRGFHTESGFAPGIETADHVDHILHSGAPQQTARDHAAISTLAMDSYGHRWIDFRRGNLEVIQREPCRIFDVPRMKLALAAHVEHLNVMAMPTLRQFI